MKLTLLTKNKPGILYKASQKLSRYGYKILEKQREYKNNSSQILYSLVLNDDGNRDGLIEALTAIDYVVEVEILEEQVLEPKAQIIQQDIQEKLIDIAQDLVNSYPNFVQMVRDMEQNIEISDDNKLQIGQYVGQGLVEAKKIKAASTKNIASSIKKLILPTVELFAIGDAQGNELQIHANPFCINKISEQASCYFLQGMIQGIFKSVTNVSEVTVEETGCKASGDICCTFKIVKN